ncbi:uncharacterized protein DS421_18g624560 [Arachis hypogaea]|nr:uncharacterized protein DS421_18g624560 [Arachis hypogaea]
MYKGENMKKRRKSTHSKVCVRTSKVCVHTSKRAYAQDRFIQVCVRTHKRKFACVHAHKYLCVHTGAHSAKCAYAHICVYAQDPARDFINETRAVRFLRPFGPIFEGSTLK